MEFLQEEKNILFSDEEKYIEKRKELSQKKLRVIYFLILISFFIFIIRVLYFNLAPYIPIQVVRNLINETNNLKLENLRVASVIAILVAMILAFSSVIIFFLKLAVYVVITTIYILKKIIEVLLFISEKLNIKIANREEKSAEGHTNLFLKSNKNNDENSLMNIRKSNEAEKLMKQQLEFGLSQYDLIDREENPKKGIEIIKILKGPTITRFTIEKNDVLIKDIKNKIEDIAITMGVQSISMVNEEGKLYLDVTNLPEAREYVFFQDIYDKFNNRNDRHPLEVPIGITATGELLIIRIDKLPHLLIAGATNSGKSVAGNVILSSLILNASPENVKLLLVDPKRVELNKYKGIPHLIRPIAKEIDEIKSALEFIINEMERRYRILEKSDCKNVGIYRSRFPQKVLPYIVVFFDEYADAIIQDKNFVEESIMRIAGKARAAGIHLLLATQRPSVNVVTGIIKANLPAALAFMVKSSTDSRVILDQTGAEKLLGTGDGLLLLPDRARPIRFQGAFIKDEEIDIIIESVVEQYSEKSEVVKSSYYEKESENLEVIASDIKEDENEIKSDEKMIFEEINENVDGNLISFICKEKIKGESILPSTAELTKKLKRRKSKILVSINNLIDLNYLSRSGGSKNIKTFIEISKEDAIRYLFYNDEEGYEEVSDEIYSVPD